VRHIVSTSNLTWRAYYEEIGNHFNDVKMGELVDIDAKSKNFWIISNTEK
jgi:hypothetical protein